MKITHVLQGLEKLVIHDKTIFFKSSVFLVNQGVKKGLHSHVDILMKPYTFGKEDPAVLNPSLIVPDAETEEEQTEELSNEEESEQIEEVPAQKQEANTSSSKKNKNSTKTKKNKKKGGKNNSPRTF